MALEKKIFTSEKILITIYNFHHMKIVLKQLDFTLKNYLDNYLELSRMKLVFMRLEYIFETIWTL
jgi:hypothetical protein